MAKTINHVSCFGSGTLDEWPLCTDLTNDDVTPIIGPKGRLGYALSFPQPALGKASGRVEGPVLSTSDGDFIAESYLRFSNINPAPDPVFFAFMHDDDNRHLFLCLVDGGQVALYDANGDIVATSASVIQANTWHKFTMYFVHGDPGSFLLKVDDVEVIDVSGEDFSATGSNERYMFRGQPGGGASPCTVTLWDACHSYDCVSPSEFYPDWDWLLYQVYVDGITPHIGDDAHWGTWKDGSEQPFNDSNHVGYTGSAGKKGVLTCHTTDGGKIPGPHGDLRAHSDEAIKAMIGLFRWTTDGLAGSPMKVRLGFIDHDTPLVDGTTMTSVGTSATWKNKMIIVQPPSALPGLDHYVQYGIELSAGLSGTAKLGDAMVILLQVPTYHGASIGSGVPGRLLRKDILTG